MKKINELRKMILLAAAFVMLFGMSALSASAAEGDPIYSNIWTRVQIAHYEADGNIVFDPMMSSYNGHPRGHINANALTQLCSNDNKKTIIIPSGSNVEITYAIEVGNNTTLIADGATIVETTESRGVIVNPIRKTNYNSVKNVTIQGGTWKNAVNKKAASMMRLAHGQNVVIKNATVYTNYLGHAVELIAMKNTTVQNCKLAATGKTYKDSGEEALQIDIAAPHTAPGIAKYGSKYVKGQTCKNIKILNNTISGSRGLCANFAPKDKKYMNKFHDNITVTGNKMTGKSAEACAMFNVLNATISNNTMVSNSTRKSEAYSLGLNIAIMGKAPSSISKAVMTVTKNTIKGGRNGMQIITKTSSKYGKAVVKSNKCYASAGKKAALAISKKAVKKATNSKNKLYKR